MWLQDTGVLKKSKGDKLEVPNHKPLAKLRINQPLSMSQLATAFILEVSGIVISILVFAVEFLQRKKHKATGAKQYADWVASTRHGHERNARRDIINKWQHIITVTQSQPTTESSV